MNWDLFLPIAVIRIQLQFGFAAAAAHLYMVPGRSFVLGFIQNWQHQKRKCLTKVNRKTKFLFQKLSILATSSKIDNATVLNPVENTGIALIRYRMSETR